VLGMIDGVISAEDVGGLTECEPEIGPFERNVPEADDAPSGDLLRGQPLRIGLDPRQRHPKLDAPLHVDELELHVNRRRELGLGGSELLQLEDLA
jgi:hypothetical protein